MTKPTNDADRLIIESRREERLSFDLATHRRYFVTATELAGYLGVDRRTIVGMITDGKLEGVKVGRCWRIPTDAACETFHVERKQAS